ISAALLAAVSAGGAGCVVGDGSGAADGALFMVGCLRGSDYGAPGAPAEYHLSPTYFVGEPIEDIADGPPSDELIIRMARNGNAPEITDTLYFNVVNSYSVATCLRGQTINGVPQWDTTATGSTDPLAMPWCEAAVPPPDGSGFPRIHLLPSGPVRT